MHPPATACGEPDFGGVRQPSGGGTMHPPATACGEPDFGGVRQPSGGGTMHPPATACGEPNFGGVLRRWEWPHVAYIRRQLQRQARGEIRNLMVLCPPQHGKSELVTVRYPVWRLEMNPTLRVVVSA